MNERIEHCLYQAGLTASGCWDELGTYEQEAIEKFAELIVQECVAICQDVDGEEDSMARSGRQDCAVEIREHFGVEE